MTKKDSKGTEKVNKKADVNNIRMTSVRSIQTAQSTEGGFASLQTVHRTEEGPRRLGDSGCGRNCHRSCGGGDGGGEVVR